MNKVSRRMLQDTRNFGPNVVREDWAHTKFAHRAYYILAPLIAAENRTNRW